MWLAKAEIKKRVCRAPVRCANDSSTNMGSSEAVFTTEHGVGVLEFNGEEMKRLLIIDGQNMFIRNYVMSPQLDINGNPIGGLTGFMRSLQKEVRRAKPDRVVVCWEGPGGSQKRREKNKNYKLGRKAPKLNREYEFATPEEERENKYEQLLRLTEYLETCPSFRCL